MPMPRARRPSAAGAAVDERVRAQSIRSSRPHRTRPRAAIRAGDTGGGAAGGRRHPRRGAPIHDMCGDLAASLLTFIADRLGEEAVKRRLALGGRGRAGARSSTRSRRRATSRPSPGLHRFLHSHRYDFSVTEDDERWVIDVHYGTSGERMLVEGKVAAPAAIPTGTAASARPRARTRGRWASRASPTTTCTPRCGCTCSRASGGGRCSTSSTARRTTARSPSSGFLIFKDPEARAAQLAAEG